MAFDIALWQYFRSINITNVLSTLPQGKAICSAMIDTVALISGGKLRSDGNDFVIAWYNGTNWIEIDADLFYFNTTGTYVWFAVQEVAGISQTWNDKYRFFYGKANEVGPRMRDWSQIWQFVDNFNRTPSDTVGGGWEEVSGDWEVTVDERCNIKDMVYGDQVAYTNIQVALGNGTTGPYTYNFANKPVLKGSVRVHEDVSGQILVDDQVGNLTGNGTGTIRVSGVNNYGNKDTDTVTLSVTFTNIIGSGNPIYVDYKKVPYNIVTVAEKGKRLLQNGLTGQGDNFVAAIFDIIETLVVELYLRFTGVTGDSDGYVKCSYLPSGEFRVYSGAVGNDSLLGSNTTTLPTFMVGDKVKLHIGIITPDTIVARASINSGNFVTLVMNSLSLPVITGRVGVGVGHEYSYTINEQFTLGTGWQPTFSTFVDSTINEQFTLGTGWQPTFSTFVDSTINEQFTEGSGWEYSQSTTVRTTESFVTGW